MICTFATVYLSSGVLAITKGDAILLDNGKISSDCVLLFDEMYLQKGVNYQGGKYVGETEDGELYKGVVCFMIVGIKESIPIVIKAIPETHIAGEWLKEEIIKSIEDLNSIGIKVRAVICDDHSSNVSTFNKIKKEFKTDSEYFFIYTTPEDNLKIYWLFDSLHLLKNIRNNLLARKKFVFPSFNFTLFAEPIFVPDGYITWSLLYHVYDHDQLLDANLRQDTN